MNKIGEVGAYYIKKKHILADKITSSKTASEILRKIYDPRTIEHREFFYVVFLDNANIPIDYAMLSSGGITGTVVDVRVLFQLALQKNAVRILISHNHPSGDLRPSTPDLAITKKIMEAGKLLDIPLMDHIIMSSESYYSFMDENELLN